MILLYTNTNQEHDFLANKYEDYIVTDSQEKTAVVSIACGFEHREKEIPSFVFKESVIERFGLFSEFFRKILMGVLNTHDGALLHASSIVYKNQGFIFIGHEGAGKTTIRKLLNNYVSLGDDTAIIRIRGEKTYLYGSPLYQRTKRSYPNKRVLICGIFSLKQAKYALINDLDLNQQVKALSSNVFLSGLKEFNNENRKLSLTLFTLGQQQLVHNLSFAKTSPVSKVLKIFAQKPWQKKSIKNLLVQASTVFVQELQDHVVWSKGVADRDFLTQCLIINEHSWIFEFGSQRILKVIADKIIGNQEEAYHHSLVFKKIKQFKEIKVLPTIVVVRKENNFVIIDGNHRALAWYLHNKNNLTGEILVLVGDLKNNFKENSKIFAYL